MSQMQMFAPRQSVTFLDHIQESAQEHLYLPAGEQLRCPSTPSMTSGRAAGILEIRRYRTADIVLSEFTADSLLRDVDEVLQADDAPSLELNCTQCRYHGGAHIRPARPSQCKEGGTQVAVSLLYSCNC